MNMTMLPALTADKLDAVRILGREGCREHTIRRALGLSPSAWKSMKEEGDDGELSPLRLALEEGRAEGAGDVIAFMKQRMRDGSERAAEFLADRVFQLNRGDGNAESPRVAIIINAALTPTEYAQLVSVQMQPARGALTHD